jgi:transcriptional regulator with XRE-family HTH domain
MNCRKIGSLIRLRRTGMNMTQLELAEWLNVSDRAVSKWERGEGCPDITVIANLALVLGISTESILKGSLSENGADRGNLKRIKFCRICCIGQGVSDTVVSGAGWGTAHAADAWRPFLCRIQ